MFKAGKKIQFKGNIVRSNLGIYVAPAIDFLGLTLNATTPILKSTEKFFQDHGAIVQIIQEDGDHLIRMSGQFDISKQNIMAFLAIQSLEQSKLQSANQNIEIKDKKESEETKEEKEISEAINFQRQLRVSFNRKILLNKPVSIAYSFFDTNKTTLTTPAGSSFTTQESEGETKISSEGSLTFHGNDSPYAMLKVPSLVATKGSIKLVVEEQANLTGDTLSYNNTIITGQSFFMKGSVVSPEIGLLGEMISLKDINIQCKDNCQIENSILRAKQSIIFDSKQGDIQISLDPKIDWINSPDSPSLTFAYDKMMKSEKQAKIRKICSASEKKDIQELKRLVEGLKRDNLDIDFPYSEGCSALHYACGKGTLEAILYLEEQNADMDRPSELLSSTGSIKTPREFLKKRKDDTYTRYEAFKAEKNSEKSSVVDKDDCKHKEGSGKDKKSSSMSSMSSKK